jgi:hypothetical protein
MRTLALALLFTVVSATGVFAQGLSVDDFYSPIQSRETMSYREALQHFNGMRFPIYQDKRMGYTIYGYLYTREMVKDHIQAIVDMFNVNDPAELQNLIDTYAYYTPSEGELYIFTYFEAPHMQNRFYKDLLDDWPSYVNFEYGVDQIQTRIEQLRDRVEGYGEDPAEEEMIFDGGTNPIKFSYTDDWLYKLDSEWTEMEYRRVSNAYENRFAFLFAETDKQRIRDLVNNKITPTMRFISGRKDMYAVVDFNQRMIGWIVRTVDPEYFEEIMLKQREGTWEGAPITDPNPVAHSKSKYRTKK